MWCFWPPETGFPAGDGLPDKKSTQQQATTSNDKHMGSVCRFSGWLNIYVHSHGKYSCFCLPVILVTKVFFTRELPLSSFRVGFPPFMWCCAMACDDALSQYMVNCCSISLSKSGLLSLSPTLFFAILVCVTYYVIALQPYPDRRYLTFGTKHWKCKTW
jgi:hypothetical protein